MENIFLVKIPKKCKKIYICTQLLFVRSFSHKKLEWLFFYRNLFFFARLNRFLHHYKCWVLLNFTRAKDDCPLFTFLTAGPDKENVTIGGAVFDEQNEDHSKQGALPL